MGEKIKVGIIGGAGFAAGELIRLIKKHNDVAFIECIIDNLMKGASRQAVQNMNIMLGIEETAGLKMKASAY